MAANRQVNQVGVDCLFEPDGQVRVRRVGFDGHWQSVGQGRQWQEKDGRHILIMLANQQTGELRLRADNLTWEMVQRHPTRTILA